jgi:hypothetical protein
MTTYVLRNGQLIEKHLAEPLHSQSNAPHVISDTMEPLKHMGTGRMIDSKAKFRADTRASGCIEIGNEPVRPRSSIRLNKRQRVESIQRAIYELRNR